MSGVELDGRAAAAAATNSHRAASPPGRAPPQPPADHRPRGADDGACALPLPAPAEEVRGDRDARLQPDRHRALERRRLDEPAAAARDDQLPDHDAARARRGGRNGGDPGARAREAGRGLRRHLGQPDPHHCDCADRNAGGGDRECGRERVPRAAAQAGSAAARGRALEDPAAAEHREGAAARRWSSRRSRRG